MTIYSFRAEFDIDVEQIEKALTELDPTISLISTPSFLVGTTYSEPFVEFTSVLDLETIRKTLDCIEDCHVPLQTLRPLPLSENSLERDHSL